MPPLDFPDTPVNGQVYAAPNQFSYIWDGAKWIGGGGPPTAFVPIAGGTMTGSLILAHDPTLPLEAATQQSVTAAPFLPTAGGVMTGALTLRAGPAVGLQDAVPLFQLQNSTIGSPFLPLGGGTLTGPLTLNADPAVALHSATKQYVDAQTAIAGNGRFLPLAGGTVTGPTTFSSTLAVNNTLTGSGNIYNGPTGAGTNASFRQGTTGAVWQFVLGAASSVLRFYDTTNAVNMLEIGGTNNLVTTRRPVQMAPSGVWAAGAAGTPQLNSALYHNTTWTGVASGGNRVYPVYIQATDNVDSVSGGGLMFLNHNTGGTAQTGSRVALLVNCNITAPAPANAFQYGQNVAAIIGQANGNVSDGGTFTAARGTVFGFNNGAQLAAGAVGYYGLIGQETDITSREQAWVKFGIHIGVAKGDAYQGAYDDAGFIIECGEGIGAPASSAVGLRYGLAFGRALGGFWPIARNGTVIGFIDQQTTPGAPFDQIIAANGLDMFNGTFTGYSLRLPGTNYPALTVDGAGAVQIGPGLISSTSNALAIDAVGSVATATTLNASGANYKTGMVFFFGNGGRGRVLTLAGTAVATYAILSYPTYNGAAPPATLPTTTPNGGGAIGQATLPAGLVLNVTWDVSAKTLALNPSGGAVTLRGMPLAVQQLLFYTGTSVGNGADVTEDVLQTYTIPANTLVNNGDRLVIRCGGTMTGSTDVKSVRIKLAGFNVASVIGNTAPAITWMGEYTLLKYGANTQTGVAVMAANAVAPSAGFSARTFTETGTIALQITGQNSTNSVAGSITCGFVTVEVIHA